MSESTVQTKAERKPRWSKTSAPGIRRLLASGVFFLNKYIAGKYCSESLGTANKKIAVIKARKRIEELEKLRDAGPDSTVDPDQLTFRKLIEDYKRHLTLQVVSGQRTARTKEFREKSTLRLLVQTWDKCPAIQAAGLGGLEQLNPARLRLQDCQEWQAYFVSDGYSPQLTNNTLSDFRTLFDIAIDNYNPTLTNWPRKLKRVPVPVKKVNLPTEEQWAQIYQALKEMPKKYPNTRHSADLVEVLSWTGLRLTECTLIQAQHVDMQKWTLFVPKEHRKGRLGKKQDLIVPIFPQARPLFERLVREADPQSKRIIHVDKAYKTLKSACRTAGFPELTHHDLRKFFATRMFLKGHSPATVAALLGQKDGGYLAMSVYSQINTRHLDALKDTTFFGAENEAEANT